MARAGRIRAGAMPAAPALAFARASRQAQPCRGSCWSGRALNAPTALRCAVLCRVAKLAAFASLSAFTETVEAGGLMAYGVDRPAARRRKANFLEKVLKCATPSDIPVQQPALFDFAINMKSANALGIKTPNAVLLRAERSIE